ncbi:MAG: tetratricopeptide repeat protein [Candidatus Thermoplasmatota archaeon]|nr:tetratricopeptide repeat protein [Candidatus Thermoplasmatota archaeon]
MQRVFSYKDANNFFKGLIGTSQLSGSSFILFGREGTGKTHLLNNFETEAKSRGYVIYRARSYSSNEVFMYQAYNELLNQLNGSFSEREFPELVERFADYNGEKVKKTIFIVEGLENMRQNSRELFIFLSKIAEKNGFVLIGTLTEDYAEDLASVSRFLNLVSLEPNIQFISFQKTTIDDIKYLLVEEKYKLPDSFIQELYRLTNGNIRYVNYTLRYYQEQGIVNAKKELEEVTYRFFPIPPSSELKYERSLLDFNEAECAILEIIALIGEELSPSFISKLIQIKRSEVLEILEKLKNKGFVIENNLNYSIINKRVAELIIKKIPSTQSYILSEEFVNQPIFADLPVMTRIKIFELMKYPELIERTLDSEWRKIMERLGHLNVSADVFRNLEKLVSDNQVKAHLEILAADSLQLMGNNDAARDIYTSEEIVRYEPSLVKLKLAKLYRKVDKYEESIHTCEDILSMKDLNPVDKAEVYITLSMDYSYLNNISLAEDFARKAMDVGKTEGIDSVMADSYHSLGTVKTRRFDLQGGLECFRQSLEINQKLKRFEKELLNLNNIAIIYSYWGRFDEAARILTEIIEKSYMSGDMVARAYATHNLCEMYFNANQFDKFKLYFQSEAGLVKLVNEGNLSFSFFRFGATVLLNLFNIKAGLTYAEELIKLAEDSHDRNKERMAMGIKLIGEAFREGHIFPEMDDILFTEFNIPDDYLPTWYTITGIYFSLRGFEDKARISYERSENSAKALGDFFGIEMSKIARCLELVAYGTKEELKTYIDQNFDETTQNYFYASLIPIFRNYATGGVMDISSTENPQSVIHLAAQVLLELRQDDIKENGTTACNLLLNKIAETSREARFI